jgi:hypothetical protein
MLIDNEADEIPDDCVEFETRQESLVESDSTKPQPAQ